jgi:hypothetical protein
MSGECASRFTLQAKTQKAESKYKYSFKPKAGAAGKRTYILKH